MKLISGDAYRKALALPDLTDPAHGPHAMQQLLADVTRALTSAWGCPLVVGRGSPLVSVAENYEDLLYEPDAAARDARYTRYVAPGLVLRTHTTAMIPGLLRLLARAPYDDVLLACPGLVYRRDAIDRRHVGEPHQLDLWRMRRAPLGEPDLRELIALAVEALVPGAESRANAADHPYTECGLEIEVRSGDDWVELAECGLASPRVLERCGLAGHSGLAMGIGLDRALMLRKGIDDIRLLRSTDPRVASQLLDLEPYRPVSRQPPVKRDLSIAVGAGCDAEELGDRIRGALGDEAAAVEAVEILTETAYAELPPQAVERLGIVAGETNVLVRVTLRHPTRTLTDEEANRLRNAVYAAIHEGRAHQWAAS
jgi:phenylalanyl-tRNA synthetase alpha chain